MIFLRFIATANCCCCHRRKQKIGQWIPLILKKHREDTLGILAAVNETTVEAVKKQSVLKTMRQIQEIVKDKDMLNFFKSCASEAKA